MVDADDVGDAGRVGDTAKAIADACAEQELGVTVCLPARNCAAVGRLVSITQAAVRKPIGAAKSTSRSEASRKEYWPV